MVILMPHPEMENKATEKETFFQELYDMDEPDYSTSDVDTLLNSLRASRPLPSRSSQNRRRPVHNSRHLRLLGRTVSAPVKSSPFPKASPLEPSHNKVKEPHAPTDAQSGLRSIANVDPQPTTEPLKMPATNRKRKRGKSLDALPEAQQIFKGLRFYFIPNDDVAPARKFRIRKALERGATWIKQWDDDVTHVIVDKHLTCSDILKFLKISFISSSIVVVNELYPAECIQFQMLVNPDQRLYRVPGRQEKPAPERDGNVESSSIKSLPLKHQPSQTPTRVQASEKSSIDQPSGEVHISHPSPKSPVRLPPESRDRPPDALDKAIEETLAVKDL
ncbi:MAG: hypothetical protein Q9211_005936, partial [Gyalolechia sp. 1 TL-2023]